MGQKPSFPAFGGLKMPGSGEEVCVGRKFATKARETMTIWDHAHSIRKNTIALERTLQKILGDIYFPFRGYLP